MNAGDRMIRAQAAAVVVAIGVVAAVVSFRHALEVVRAHGETGVTVYLSPLTIDGLVYVASMVMLDAARRGQRAPGLAKWALGLGIGATVAVNVLHGIAHGPVGAVIAAWPAVCLVLVVELLMGMIRRGRAGAEVVPVEGLEVSGPVSRVARLAGDELAEPLGGTAPEPLVETARNQFADTLAAGEVPSVRAIRRELRVGHPRAVAIRSALADQ